MSYLTANTGQYLQDEYTNLEDQYKQQGPSLAKQTSSEETPGLHTIYSCETTSPGTAPYATSKLAR